MGRVEDAVAATGGVAEFTDLRSAWTAAGIVSERFGDGPGSQARRVWNWLRFAGLTRVVVNRERTAVIGLGGARPGAVAAGALLAAVIAPRLPRPVLAAVVAATAVATLRRQRLARLLWVSATLRREAPGALLVGEFATRQSGAGVDFAREAIAAIGTHVTLALTVQGAPEDRHVRSLVRLYERRLGFRVAARRQIGAEEVLVMVRPRTGVPAPTALELAAES